MYKKLSALAGVLAVGVWVFYNHLVNYQERQAQDDARRAAAKNQKPKLIIKSDGFIYADENTPADSFLSIVNYKQDIRVKLSDNKKISEQNVVQIDKIVELHLTNMSQISGQYFHKLKKLQKLYLENCENFHLANLLKNTRLKEVHVRNMPKTEDGDIAKLEEKGIRVIDER